MEEKQFVAVPVTNSLKGGRVNETRGTTGPYFRQFRGTAAGARALVFF